MRFLKIAAIFAAAAMMLSLFACGNGNSDKESITSDFEEGTGTVESSVNIPDGTESESAVAPGGSSESEETQTEANPGSSSHETQSAETESESAETKCYHTQFTIVEEVHATCTEDGNEAYNVCICGALFDMDGNEIDAVPVIAAKGHTVAGPFSYVANADGDEALLCGVCRSCEQPAVKPASFYLTIENIYGDVNDESVTVFPQNGENPIMGMEMLKFAPGHEKYPESGYAPIRDNFPQYGGMLGLSGWIGYLGSEITDGAAFKVLDLEGNELMDWTAIGDVGLGLHSSDATVDEFVSDGYTDGEANGIRFNHIVNVSNYKETLGGKTVIFVFAFVTAEGVDGDVYIPYATLQVGVPE